MSSLLYFYTWCGLSSANLKYRSEMCCTRLAENAGRKKSPKISHLGTIAQYFVGLYLRNEGMHGQSEKLVKWQYLLHVPTIYGELRPTNG